MSTAMRYKSKLVNPEEKQDHEKQYVGFATLPNQVHRKSVKKGFDFTLMVAGESGLGKSTLVNSLFLTDLYKDRKLLNAEERINQTVEIIKHTVDIEEKGVKLKLTIVDTPGFGDAVNNTECWKPITDYIDQQFEQYFRDESGLNRKNIQDNRVHCCLYFISPLWARVRAHTPGLGGDSVQREDPCAPGLPCSSLYTARAVCTEEELSGCSPSAKHHSIPFPSLAGQTTCKQTEQISLRPYSLI
uniref:Uncharacterized protein n=1 Tax=Geospiza parvula TaxID=87175 RepID=A0A8U8C950_GEOPR